MNEPENVPLPSFLHEHADWVTRLSRALVYRDEAEDVAQSTWLQLLRSPPPPECDSKAWIFGVLRRSVLKSNDAKRKAARDQELHRRIPTEFYAPSTDDLVDEIALQRAVSGAVLALPEKYRAVIVLCYYQDLAPNLIAEKLELPVKTVHTRLRRGREQLRQKLDRRFGSRNLWMGLLIPHLGDAPSTATIKPPVASRVPWSPALRSWSGVVLPLAVSLMIIVPVGIWALSGREDGAKEAAASTQVASAEQSESREPLGWARSEVPETPGSIDRLALQPDPPQGVSEPSLADQVAAVLENFRGFEPSMARVIGLAELALHQVKGVPEHPAFAQGFWSWDIETEGVTITPGYATRAGQVWWRLVLRLDDDYELPAPFSSHQSLLELMLGKDSTGRDVMIGTVSSNPRPVEEAGPREGTFGYSFALRDPSQLTMKRFFFRTHPNPEPELTHLRTRWPADSDAGQAAVSRLRESFQLRIPVEASPEDLSSDPVPVEIENALAHTSGECSDLVWLDELVRSLASILPTADELLPFTTKGGIKCYSIPATGTLSAYWLRFRDGDAEKIRLVIESGVNSPMESLESEGRPAEITLLASREGKDYRVFAGVECGITNGTGFLLGPNGTFKMKPCLDEEGKYSSISFTDMVKSDLPSRSSGLPADAAESLWKALDAYLPQLSE